MIFVDQSRCQMLRSSALYSAEIIFGAIPQAVSSWLKLISVSRRNQDISLESSLKWIEYSFQILLNLPLSVIVPFNLFSCKNVNFYFNVYLFIIYSRFQYIYDLKLSRNTSLLGLSVVIIALVSDVSGALCTCIMWSESSCNVNPWSQSWTQLTKLRIRTPHNKDIRISDYVA
jgi:hypothetical protein